MKYVICILTVLLCISCKQRPQPAEAMMESEIDSMEMYGCCAPEVLDKSWYTSGKKAPIFSGLEGIHFPITTTSKEAQQYFDQGLMLSFGFNHAEAGRSFYEAARQDSSCAMCWWGFAYVLGPNYNAGMEPDNFQRAYDAAQKAKMHAGNVTGKEKALIDAIQFRYTNDTTVGRPQLDSAFAVAMRKVYHQFPGDVTVASLFTESLMDLHPWNLWKKDGTIQPWTPEIVSVLEKCLAQEPRHVGANHFYIHAVEMSQTAEKSLPSANLLLDLVPGSGHLVHMPSHTYIRIGKYHDGVIANQKAVMVDSLYMEACHAQGVYPLAYYPHNHHFIAACATFSGESKAAMVGARATSEHAHKKLFKEPAWATLQHYYSIPWYVQVKLKYPLVVWNYAQGMAALATNNVADANKNLATIREIMKDTTIRELTIWGINNVYDLCLIAEKVLEGEISAKEKKYSNAIKLLKEAVVMEDALNYDEPPDWFFSVRHHLGAVIVESGTYMDAIKIYEEDLKIYRENGWALRGLMNVYEKLADNRKYKAVKERFDEAWKYADIQISSSRIL
jgi:tetratricopeptide (TPR) repeat protein